MRQCREALFFNMPYTTQAAIQAKVPAQILTDALDDNGDGLPDAGLLDAIIANASDAVDAYLCNRIALPLPNPTASVRIAALWFAIEEIYGRRQAELPPEFAKAIANACTWLEAIRDGKQQLDATAPIVLQAAAGSQPAIPGRIPMGGDGSSPSLDSALYQQEQVTLSDPSDP